MATTVSTTANTLDSTWPTDVLEAVKLDPAVLDVQITVGGNKSKSPSLKSETSNGSTLKFEEMVRTQKQQLLSLAPQQLELLLKYASILRMQRLVHQKQLECAFCKNNGESSSWYSSHKLKDSRGRVLCPVLRGYRCRGCGATGDQAHTIKYCPENPHGIRWSRY